METNLITQHLPAYHKKCILVEAIKKCCDSILDKSQTLNEEEVQVLLEKFSSKIHRHGTTAQKLSQLATLLHSSSVYRIDALEDLMTIIGLVLHSCTKTLDAIAEAIAADARQLTATINGNATSGSITVGSDSFFETHRLAHKTIDDVHRRLHLTMHDILEVKTKDFTRSHIKNRDRREQHTRDHIQSLNMLITRYITMDKNFVRYKKLSLSSTSLADDEMSSEVTTNDSTTSESERSSRSRSSSGNVAQEEYLMPPWCCINLAWTDLNQLSLASLNLRYVVFGKELNNVDLRGCALQPTQLQCVKSLKTVKLDDWLASELKEVRYNMAFDMLKKIEVEMMEARLAIDCLHYYYLFVCDSFEEMTVLSETLHHLPLRSLKMVVFLLMNDAFINLLPESHQYCPSTINDRRELVFAESVDHRKCVEMVIEMLSARNYNLPAEMLSVSIDAKIYSLYNAIDDRKMTMLDLMQLGIDDSENDNDVELVDKELDGGRPVASNQSMRSIALKEMIDNLMQQRSKYIADRSHNEQFHDLARIGYFLLAIGTPVDPSLGMNSTERFLGALRLSLQHNSIIDLRAIDLKSVDLSNINFSGAKTLVTAEQENLYFSSNQRQQLRSRYFKAAREGNIEELSLFLSPPFSYNVNLRNEVGRTALMYACFEGHVDMVKLLVGTYKADVVLGTDMGGTAIQALIMLKQRSKDNTISRAANDILDYLVEIGVHFSAQALAELGDLSRLKACSTEALDSLQDSGGGTSVSPLSLRSKGKVVCKPDATMATPDGGESVVHIAARHGRVDILEHCALRGVNMCRPNYAGLNSLHIACSYGKTSAALFLGRHVDVNTPYRTKSNALKLALEGKHLECAKALKENFPHIRVPDVWCAVMLRDMQSVFAFIATAGNDSIGASSNHQIATNGSTPTKTPPAAVAHTRSSISSVFSGNRVQTVATSAAALPPVQHNTPPAPSNPQSISALLPGQLAVVTESLFHACQSDWVELVRMLLKRYGPTPIWERVSAIYGNLRPIDICVEENKLDLVKLLIRNSEEMKLNSGSGGISSVVASGVSVPSTPGAEGNQNTSGDEPWKRCHPIVKNLINNIEHATGVTTVSWLQQNCLLLRAIRHKYWSIASLLIRRGADVNIQVGGKYLIHHFLFHGSDFKSILQSTQNGTTKAPVVSETQGSKSNISSAFPALGLAPEFLSDATRSTSVDSRQKGTLKTEMFDRLEKRLVSVSLDGPTLAAELAALAASGKVDDDANRPRSTAVWSRRPDSVASSGVMSSIRVSDGVLVAERDSDEDTDYGDPADGSQSDSGDDIFDDDGDDDDIEDSGLNSNSKQRKRSSMNSAEILIRQQIRHVCAVLRIMIRAGADVFARDLQGNSCFHYAAKFDSPLDSMRQVDSIETLTPTRTESNASLRELYDGVPSDLNDVARIILSGIFSCPNHEGEIAWGANP